MSIDDAVHLDLINELGNGNGATAWNMLALTIRLVTITILVSGTDLSS